MVKEKISGIAFIDDVCQDVPSLSLPASQCSFRLCFTILEWFSKVSPQRLHVAGTFAPSWTTYKEDYIRDDNYKLNYRPSLECRHEYKLQNLVLFSTESHSVTLI